MPEDMPKRSEKNEQARSTLPEELRLEFDQFVEDYKLAGMMHHGSPFVSYIILAEMIRAGWRRTAKPMHPWKTPQE